MKALKFAALLLCASLAPATGSFQMSAQVNQADAEMNIIPDKTTKTDNGIRISAVLVGIPHTSQCINGVDLVIGSKLVKATDIDGIDFERAFQFEDSGVQTVEIDFPFSGALPKTAKLVFHTDAGDITAPARQ